MVKSLPAKQEIVGPISGQEDPPEKEMATHSSIPAWRIPWTEDPSGLYVVHWVAESDRTQRLNNNNK